MLVEKNDDADRPQISLKSHHVDLQNVKGEGTIK